MDENLVGYLLNSLDDAGQREMENYLAANPAARQRLEVLRHALEPLAADKEEAPAPAGLVIRTLARVAEYCSNDLPRAPKPSLAFAGERPRWRRFDVLAAACLLIALLGIGIPAALRMRERAAQTAECQNNLRAFFAALHTYHDQRGQFPDVNAQAPHNAAGMVVPMLINAGTLAPEVNIRCPGNGPGKVCPLTFDEIKALSPEEFKKIAPALASCYAYSLGYRDETGGYHSPGVVRGMAVRYPLMSDRPPPGIAQGKNSPNHGGTGQNVLFQDGHVTFLTGRFLDLDDIFLNRANKEAAGIGPEDVVLGYSGASP
jgi:prepilin-type processing-associated H-X9-DG protein